MVTQRRYSDEQRAQVLAALLAGQSVRDAAKAYNIPRGTVAGWAVASKIARDPVGSDTKKEIGDLILNYLREVLVTLSEQQQVFRDETWLRKQSASEVAVLHGVLADKGIRLLEALATNEPEPDDDDQEL